MKITNKKPTVSKAQALLLKFITSKDKFKRYSACEFDSDECRIETIGEYFIVKILYYGTMIKYLFNSEMEYLPWNKR